MKKVNPTDDLSVKSIFFPNSHFFFFPGSLKKEERESVESASEEEQGESLDPEVRRLKWLKKKTDDDAKDSDDERDEKWKEKEEEIKRKQDQIKKGLERRLKKQYEEDGVTKNEERKVEYTADLIAKKLKEIVENRYLMVFY